MPTSNKIAIGISIMATTVLFSSCASVPNVSFVPATSNTYEERDELPTISILTDGELISGGYVNIGSATATQVVENCWGESLDCAPVAQSVSVATALLNEAMGQGADIVVLTADSETRYDFVDKRGKCLKSERVCASALGRAYPSPCLVTIKGRCSPTPSDVHCEEVCTTYEKIIGQVQLEISSGTLWRYQPD